MKFVDKKHNFDVIKDINDSNIYKTLLESSDGVYVLTHDGFTFTINTDGVEICSKSDISIWPVFLVINEIELRQRFCLESIIVAGLFVGTKPNFDILMKPIVAQLKSLEYGLIMQQNNFSTKILRFYLLFGIFDKPARTSILNTKTSNGYFGCIKCLQPGQRYKTLEIKNKNGNYYKI